MNKRHRGFLLLQETPRFGGHSTPTTPCDLDGGSRLPGSGPAWTERWCVLEGGRILVYSDSVAATVEPTAWISVIDLTEYHQIHTSSHYSSGGQRVWELTLLAASHGASSLSTAPGLSKSTTFAGLGLHCDRMAVPTRCSELFAATPGPSRSISKAASPTILQGLQGIAETEADPSDKDRATSDRSRTWSKLTSKSRRLYKLVSGGSSSSLSEQFNQTGSKHNGRPELRSPLSDSFSTSSMSMASTRVSSPTTPNSFVYPEVGTMLVGARTFRVTSAQALAEWDEALSASIGLNRDPIDQISHEEGRRVVKGAKSGSHAPHVASLFPIATSDVSTLMTEAAAQSRRRRQESLSSLRQQQGEMPTAVDQGASSSDLLRRRRQPRPPCLSGDLSTILQMSGASDFSRPSTASTASRRASIVDSISRAARSRPASSAGPSMHERRSSIVSTSGPSSVKLRPVSMRRASTSALLDDCLKGSEARSEAPPSSQHEYIVAASSHLPIRVPRTDEHVGEAPSRDSVGASTKAAAEAGKGGRHKRSGSLLRRGSWRVAPTASKQGEVGLGLELLSSGMEKLHMSSLSESSAKDKGSFAKLKSSLGMRPGSRAGRRASIPEFDVVVQPSEEPAPPPQDANVGQREPASAPLAPAPGGTGSTRAAGAYRGIPRAASLLSLSKFGVGASRDKTAAAKPSPTETGTARSRLGSNAVARSPASSNRLELEGCDFSYELVDSANDAASSRAVTPSGMAASMSLSVVSSQGRERGAVARLATRLESRKRALTPSPRHALKSLEPISSRDEPPMQSTPPVVERILPPEEMIATFDRLREAEELSFGSASKARLTTASPARADAFASSNNILGLSIATPERSVLPLPARGASRAGWREGSEATSPTSPKATSGASLDPFARPHSPLFDAQQRLPHSFSACNFGEVGSAGFSALQRSGWPLVPPFDRLESERDLGSHANRSLPAPPRAAKRVKDSSAKPPPTIDDGSEDKREAWAETTESKSQDADVAAAVSADLTLAATRRRRFTSTALLSQSNSASSQLTNKGSGDGAAESAVGDASFSSFGSARHSLTAAAAAAYERRGTRTMRLQHAAHAHARSASVGGRGGGSLDLSSSTYRAAPLSHARQRSVVVSMPRSSSSSIVVANTPGGWSSPGNVYDENTSPVYPSSSSPMLVKRASTRTTCYDVEAPPLVALSLSSSRRFGLVVDQN